MAAAISAATGAPASPSTQMLIRAAPWTPARTRSMDSPLRSTSRPWSGAPNALPSASAPETRPAPPNEPVTSRA